MVEPCEEDPKDLEESSARVIFCKFWSEKFGVSVEVHINIVADVNYNFDKPRKLYA